MSENRNWLLAVALTLVGIFCREPLYNIAYSLLIRHLEWVTSTPLNDVLVIFVMVILTIRIACLPRGLKKNRRTGLLGWTCAVMLTLFYLYIRIVHTAVLVPFYVLPQVYYADTFLLYAVLWYVIPCAIISCKQDAIAIKEGNNGSDGSTHVLGEGTYPKKDLLGRGIEVNTVFGYLTSKDNHYDEAIAVAITGSWGSGKTTFLHQLQEKFDANGIEYFEYSPWHKSGDVVTVDFLQHLREHLCTTEQGFVFDSLDRYIMSLKVSNVTNWFSWTIHTLRHIWNGDNSITQQISNVKQEMSLLSKPVYAFIDDIDRVDEKDLRDVMALVRSTASFPNLVYIVAYDREVTAKMLGEEYGEKYLTKIFNASFGLQAVDEEQMQKLAADMLYEAFPDIKQDVPAVYPPFVGLELTQYLPTLRDLYRYLNLFAKDYEAMRELRTQTWFDYETFSLLELLKHTDLLTWELLKAKPAAFLYVDNGFWDYLAKYKLKENLELDNKRSLELLKYIFRDERKTECEFLSPGGLQMMFMNELPAEYVTKQEFEEAIESGRFVDYAKLWVKSKENLFFCIGHRLDLPVEQIADISLLAIVNRIYPMSLGPEMLKMETDTHSLSSFSSIRGTASPYTYVEKHHELYLMLHEKALADDNGNILTALKKKAGETVYPREMLAIVYGMMQIDAQYEQVPEKWIYSLEQILFERLVNENDMTDLDKQYQVVEAIEYLPIFDYVNILTKPLMEMDLNTWIRLTLRVDNNIDGSSQIIVNPEVMHTLFNTHKQYQELMSELRQHYASDVNALAVINEHERLTQNTSLIMALTLNSFNLKSYPMLDSIHEENQADSIYVDSFYDRAKELLKSGSSNFFNNQSRQMFELFDE